MLHPRGTAHPHSISIYQMWLCCQGNEIFNWCQLQARDNQWFHSGQTLLASGEGKDLGACNGVADYAAVVWYPDSVVFRNGQLHMCHWSDFFRSNWSIISRRTDFLFNRFLLLSTEMLIVSGHGRSLFYFNPLPQCKLFILVISLILCHVNCLSYFYVAWFWFVDMELILLVRNWLC